MARRRGKKGQKSQEISWREEESIGKNGSKMTPEAAHHNERKVEANGKIWPKMTPDSVPHDQGQAEANDEESQKTPEAEIAEEFRKTPYDIYRFICHWAYVFMCVFAMAYVVMTFSGDKFLNYDEALWMIVLKICFLYLIAAVCALIALKELPGLLDFVLKFTGVLSFFIVGIFTIFILTRSNWPRIILNETFVKGVNSMCILWWILIASLVATVMIKDQSQLKLELRSFLNFFTICGGAFMVILSTTMFMAIGNETNLFGIFFDEYFLKFAVILSVIHFQVFTSVIYVRYILRKDSDLFGLPEE